MEPMIEVFRKVNACSRLIFLECLEATKLVRQVSLCRGPSIRFS